MPFQLVNIPVVRGVQVIPVGISANTVWIPPTYEVNGIPTPQIPAATNSAWVAINDPTATRHWFSMNNGLVMYSQKEPITTLYVEVFFSFPLMLAVGSDLTMQWASSQGTVVLSR